MGRGAGGGRAVEPPPAMIPGQPRPNSITTTAECIPEAGRQPARHLHPPPLASPGHSPGPASSSLENFTSLTLASILVLPHVQLRK